MQIDDQSRFESRWATVHGGSSQNSLCWNLQTVSQPQSLPEKKETAATAQSSEPEGTELLSPSLVVFTGKEKEKKKKFVHCCKLTIRDLLDQTSGPRTCRPHRLHHGDRSPELLDRCRLLSPSQYAVHRLRRRRLLLLSSPPVAHRQQTISLRPSLHVAVAVVPSPCCRRRLAVRRSCPPSTLKKKTEIWVKSLF